MTSALVNALKKKFSCAADAMRALDLPVELLTGKKEDNKLAEKVMRLLLKRHGGSERAVLRHLGMDTAMLELTEPEHMRSDPRGEGGGGGEIEGGVARRGEDRFGLRRTSRDNIPDKVETMPEEVLGASDDEDDDELYDPLREHLRKNTDMSEDQIEKACELAKDHVRRRSSNGKDRMPINRTLGGKGGHFGGERHGQRADGAGEVEAIRQYAEQIDEGEDRRRVGRDQPDMTYEPSGENERKFLVDHGLDGSRGRRRGADRQAVDAIHRQLGRFGPEVGCRPMRPHEMGASDQVQTMAKRARTEARYPGLARIGEV